MNSNICNAYLYLRNSVYNDVILPHGLGSCADTTHKRTLRATKRIILNRRYRKTIQNSGVLQILTDLNRTLVFISCYQRTWHKYLCRYKIQKDASSLVTNTGHLYTRPLNNTSKLYLFFIFTLNITVFFYDNLESKDVHKMILFHYLWQKWHLTSSWNTFFIICT